jgi:hypothetical protein
VSKELTIGSKTMPTIFFVVDVKGHYNMLLGRDLIHANGCIPSTLHQCIAQWVGNKVEIFRVDDSMCVALAETQVDIQGGKTECLTGRDLTDYDFVSVGKGGFVPISVKSMTEVTRVGSSIG